MASITRGLPNGPRFSLMTKYKMQLSWLLNISIKFLVEKKKNTLKVYIWRKMDSNKAEMLYENLRLLMNILWGFLGIGPLVTKKICRQQNDLRTARPTDGQKHWLIYPSNWWGGGGELCVGGKGCNQNTQYFLLLVTCGIFAMQSKLLRFRQPSHVVEYLTDVSLSMHIIHYAIIQCTCHNTVDACMITFSQLLRTSPWNSVLETKKKNRLPIV